MTDIAWAKKAAELLAGEIVYGGEGWRSEFRVNRVKSKAALLLPLLRQLKKDEAAIALELRTHHKSCRCDAHATLASLRALKASLGVE